MARDSFPRVERVPPRQLVIAVCCLFTHLAGLVGLTTTVGQTGVLRGSLPCRRIAELLRKSNSQAHVPGLALIDFLPGARPCW